MNHGVRKTIYDVYKTILIAFCSIHTFAELFMITYGVKQLSIDELTVSVAYGIQHFLGIAKVYIMISRKYDFLELDRRTKTKPLYRREDPRFLKEVHETASLSDKIGYIYWFAVLVTISCGGVTGIYMTLKNKHDMTIICREKYQQYENYMITNQINISLGVSAVARINNDDGPHNGNKTVSRQTINRNTEMVEINDLFVEINRLEKMFKEMNLAISDAVDEELKCHRPKRVFPYHIWLPYGTYSRFFEILLIDIICCLAGKVIFALNFLAGFLLVCCILPIDLLVMSFMRYIRFQFYVIKEDLINLRQNVENELKCANNGNSIMDEKVIAVYINGRLKDIVNHHMAVFDFFNRADDLFTWALFAQYLGSGAMICGVLFSISSVADDMMTPKFFHVAFFYSGLLIQLYCNCFYGNEVLVLSSSMGEYAYFSDWQKSGKFTKRIRPALLMIMRRSLRACRLTAGKFAAVDLPTFLAVFKASYTYYTVLVDDRKN